MLSSKSLSTAALRILKAANDKSRSSRSRKSQFQYEQYEARQMLATIGWVSGDITQDSDVSVNGALVFALNASDPTGNPTTAVNGVNFVASNRADAGVQAQTQSPGNESISTTLGNDNVSAFETGGLGGDIGEIIRGGWWGTTSGTSAAVTLTGLTVGDTYEVQIFSNDARSTRDDSYISRLDNGAGGTGVDLALNNQPSGGLAGDFGIGTFTADSASQSINITGILNGSENGGRVQVNAIQLRNVVPPTLLPGSVPLINEFSASNAGVIDDDNGNSTDWIELYNAGEDTVNLAGYSLTDDATNPTKYVLPSTTLVGGQYLIVFAGDDADPTTGSDLYTGFGLSSGGEYLGFFDPAGNLVSEFGTGGTNYPAQFTDVSYGYENDDTFSVSSFFATATPGSANVSPVDGVIDTLPTVSVERGFYDQAFTVNVASTSLGATLVYTTDGSEPSLSNGTQVLPTNASSLVQTNIFIDETTSLRTAAFQTGFLTRAFTTHTYVFLDDVIATDLASSPETNALLRQSLLDIPTLSFNYEDVITDSDVPEQLASIEWLAPDGSEGFQIDAGIKGFGGYFTNFAKKNFRVNFRSQYGESKLDFPLFEGFDNGIPAATEGFDSLDFRSGSHDMVARGFYMSNRFTDDTLLELGHVAPHGRFVHIYTNGEYWGQYHMRERWDADFLSQYYGGDSDDYEAVNGNVNNGQSTPNGWSPGEVYDGTGAAWSNINDLADTDGSGNPTGGYQELKEVVDLANLIDVNLIYMAGSSENEYRSGGSSDGSVPYTFTLNDADGYLRGTGDRTNNAGPGNILGTLVDEADPEFMSLYADRIENLFGPGGVLSPENATARLEARLDEIDLSFHAEAARWGYRSYDSWDNAAQGTLNDELQTMADEMITNLRNRGIIADFDAPSYVVDGTTLNGGDITAGASLTIDAEELVYYTVDGTDPRLVGGLINPNAIAYSSSAVGTTIFGNGINSDWKYYDNYTSLDSANWTASGYNDSGWAEGPSELGYGDNDEATVVGTNVVNGTRNPTTYFRKTFNVPAGSYTSASLSVLYDDAVAVYLNGVELGRENLAAGALFADYSIGNQEATETYNINPSLLNAGSNTLAVEIHQASNTSTDISFDATLTVVSPTGSSSQPYILNTSTNVQARTYRNGEWSGLNDSIFALPASQSDLRISEIYYNPSDPTPAEIAAGFDDNDEFEFIEIVNSHPTGTVNLTGVQLANGVTYEFSDIDLLPGERVVVVENAAAFNFRYGSGISVLGEWTGGLSNSGENIELLDANLNEFTSVNYGDNDPWYIPTDGHGFSLVLDDAFNTPAAELGKYYSWRASTELGGTPGQAPASPLGIVVNEVLAHSGNAGQFDTIELYNPTGSSIDVSGWYLSDEGDELLKFQIPAGTVIAAGGYLVYDEQDFNPTPATPGANDFALSSSNGDQVYLSRASAGTFVGLEDAVEFDATFNGDSLGRLPNGTGRLVRLASTSFGSVNGAHALSDVIISEVNYHPENPSAAALAIDPLLIDSDLEFIEISNASGSTIDLTDWSLRGESDYDFAAGTMLTAGSSLAVISFDPSDPLNATRLNAFMAHYGLTSSANLVGGFTGTLSNSSGRVSLQQPDAPDMGVIPGVVVDEVVYDDLSPWANADGSGDSLNRDGLVSLGSAATSWLASTPTPGVAEIGIGRGVVDLIVGGTGFSPEFVDAVDGGGVGAGNDLGYSLAGGHQLETLPWSGIDTLYMQFTGDVSATLTAGSVLLTGTNGGSYSLGTITVDSNNIATIPVIGGIASDSLVLTIFDNTVTTASGTVIGGTGGGQFDYFFNVLVGDENASDQVNSTDAFAVFSSNTDAVTELNFRRDIDGSGQINSTDAFLAFGNNTNGLPAVPTPPSPPAPVLSSPITITESFSAVAAFTGSDSAIDAPVAVATVVADSAPELALVGASSATSPLFGAGFEIADDEEPTSLEVRDSLFGDLENSDLLPELL